MDPVGLTDFFCWQLRSQRTLSKVVIFPDFCFASWMISGQIIATSHDLTPKCSLVREISLFQENLGW